tara:strand:+ start:467 stop:1117 length:651 start_codon:yes stop_codon:yes gene_type:complete
MIIQLLNDDEVQQCLDGCSELKDGTDSQPLSTQYNIKKNKESINIPDSVRALVTFKIHNNLYIDSVISPKRVSLNFYNEYGVGDYYNKHVDSFKATPKHKNTFFDYGFSLCLNDDYEGGEFVLENDVGEMIYDIKKGQILIFPIIYPHKITKVTSGSRKAMIGWMSSRVSYEQSHILKQMFFINMDAIKSGNEDIIVKSSLVQNYLQKLWSKNGCA